MSSVSNMFHLHEYKTSIKEKENKKRVENSVNQCGCRRKVMKKEYSAHIWGDSKAHGSFL